MKEWCFLCLLFTSPNKGLSWVVSSKVKRPVSEDSQHWYSESSVESWHAFFFEDFSTAVDQTFELSLSLTLTDVGCQSCSGEVQRIHKYKTYWTCSTSWNQRSYEVLGWLGFRVNSRDEYSVDVILHTEVNGLRRKISEYIRPISSP